MRYSVFTVLDDSPGHEDPRVPDRYERALELARTADKNGYDAFWVAEHHLHHWGVLPSPPVLLAAAARETRRVRLGVLVSVLPLHDPRLLAEEYALVDRLSQGRLELGVGSGNTPQEHDGFGIDPARKRELFDANLPIFLSALRGEPWQGRDPKAPSVRLNVSPIQQPQPPLWMAAGRRETAPFVGRRGFNLALIPYATLDDLEDVKRTIATYREALPAGVTGRVLAAFHTYVGENPEDCHEALDVYLGRAREAHSEGYAAKVARDHGSARREALQSKGMFLIGRAGEVRSQLRDLESAGVTDVAGIFDFGGLAPEKVRASVEAFAQLVARP